MCARAPGAGSATGGPGSPPRAAGGGAGRGGPSPDPPASRAAAAPAPAGTPAAPAPGHRRRRGPSPLRAGQLSPDELGARDERAELLVAHVARAPAEATVGIDRELFGPADLEDAADARGHLLGRVLVEALHVDDAGAEFAAVPVLLPEVQLRHLAPGELKHELVGAGLEEPGEVGRVRALEARAAETVAEADMVGEARAHPLGGGVEEPRHLLARDGASRRLVDLDEVGAGGDEPAELRVDDLGEALRDVDHPRVQLAGVDAGAERQRPGARRLGAAGRVGLEVLELLDDAEAAGRRLDAPDRLVARLLVVPPGTRLAAHRQRLDALDDRIVRVDVPVKPAHLAVGNDVDSGPLHVADRGIGGIVHRLLEIGG